MITEEHVERVLDAAFAKVLGPNWKDEPEILRKFAKDSATLRRNRLIAKIKDCAERNLTIAQTARETGVSDPLVRYYADKYRIAFKKRKYVSRENRHD